MLSAIGFDSLAETGPAFGCDIDHAAGDDIVTAIVDPASDMHDKIMGPKRFAAFGLSIDERQADLRQHSMNEVVRI